MSWRLEQKYPLALLDWGAVAEKLVVPTVLLYVPRYDNL